jgi:HEAT repeat protein
MDDLDSLMRQFLDPTEDKICLIDEAFAHLPSDTAAKFLLEVAASSKETIDVRYAALRNLRYCFPKDPTVVIEVVQRTLQNVADRTDEEDIRAMYVEVLLNSPRSPQVLDALTRIVCDVSESVTFRLTTLQGLAETPLPREVLLRLTRIPATDPLATYVRQYIAQGQK